MGLGEKLERLGKSREIRCKELQDLCKKELEVRVKLWHIDREIRYLKLIRMCQMSYWEYMEELGEENLLKEVRD